MPPLLRKTSIICLAIALSCAYCHPRSKQTPPANPSFYYWRSVYSLTSKERYYLERLGVTQLYMRFFDVTWDARQAKAIPTAPIRFTDTPTTMIVPVVFITNEVLAKLDSEKIHPLATNIATLVTQMKTTNHLNPIQELQLDADWTTTTKEKYFTLLKDLRQWLDTHNQSTVKLSATIRLYQCKYRDLTGVPPVEKGLLMCYNMGDLKNPRARNSILETAELEKYIDRLSTYPLPLDVALPIFNWKVYFHDGHYAGLIESLPNTELTQTPKTDNLFAFQKDTSLQGYQFQTGDQLRDEQCEYADLEATAKTVANHLKNPPTTVLFFHLDSTNLSNYTPHELENIFARFN